MVNYQRVSKYYNHGCSSKLKNKKFHIELVTRYFFMLFFHFQVINLNLKNMKFYFELLIQKMIKQNLDFEIAHYLFFI